MEKKSMGKKILRILSSVLLYAFLILAVVTLVLTVLSKRDSDGAATLFGYQMRVVTSDSMAECEATDVSEFAIKSIPVRSMIFVELVPEDKTEADAWYSSVQVGDVLTFRYVYTSQVTITHRVTSITAKETGGYIIELEGDNKSSDSNLLTQIIDTSETNSPNYVVGKVVGQNYLLGFLISLLSQPVGLVFIIIVPCFIVILLEVIKIIGVVNADKKQREQEKQKEKDDEIEALKRRLAALEQGAGGTTDAAQDESDRSCPLPNEIQEQEKSEEQKESEEQTGQEEEASDVAGAIADEALVDATAACVVETAEPSEREVVEEREGATGEETKA